MAQIIDGMEMERLTVDFYESNPEVRKHDFEVFVEFLRRYDLYEYYYMEEMITNNFLFVGSLFDRYWLEDDEGYLKERVAPEVQDIFNRTDCM